MGGSSWEGKGQGRAAPARLRLVGLLLEKGELGGQELQEALGLSRALVSHHLRALYGGRLVEKCRRGKEVSYRLSHPLVRELVRVVLGQLPPVAQ